jgi:hypothetical protein
MNCYNTGQPGCQGDVRRTVAGRACCWPCGTRLLAAAREGLTVRDYGDEQAEVAPEPAHAGAQAGRAASERVGTGDRLGIALTAPERLANQASTIDALRAENERLRGESADFVRWLRERIEESNLRGELCAANGKGLGVAWAEGQGMAFAAVLARAAQLEQS